MVLYVYKLNYSGQAKGQLKGLSSLYQEIFKYVPFQTFENDEQEAVDDENQPENLNTTTKSGTSKSKVTVHPSQVALQPQPLEVTLLTQLNV